MAKVKSEIVSAARGIPASRLAEIEFESSLHDELQALVRDFASGELTHDLARGRFQALRRQWAAERALTRTCDGVARGSRRPMSR